MPVAINCARIKYMGTAEIFVRGDKPKKGPTLANAYSASP